MSTSADQSFLWNSRTARHLLVRAGFGTSPKAIQTATDIGLDKTVGALLGTLGDIALPSYNWEDEVNAFDPQAFRKLSREEKQAWNRKNRQWTEEMLEGLVEPQRLGSR